MQNTKTLNKTPEITITFWLLNLLLTMVGGSGLDFLDNYIGLGSVNSTKLLFVLLLVAMMVQFRCKKYDRWVYWSVVLLLGTFGMAVVDNLTTDIGVPLEFTAQTVAILLVMVTALWLVVERTLSIHSIVTRRREIFYWLTVWLVFVVGTAFDQWLSEIYGMNYFDAVMVFGGAIGFIAACHYAVAWVLSGKKYYHPAQHVLAFWLAYILIRPLAQALGDYLSQAVDNGGLGISDAVTSPLAMVLTVIILLRLDKTKKDVIKKPE